MGTVLGLSHLGVHATRLAQAAELRVRVREPTHMQLDGEPWLQQPATVHIQHFGQSSVLRS